MLFGVYVVNKTLLLIKPDAFQQKLVGKIISILEKKFDLIKIKLFKFSVDEAKEFYYEHKDKIFYNELISFITSDFIVAIILRCEGNAIYKLRRIIGNTDFKKASKRSIRGRFATGLTTNVVHASDTLDSYAREVKIIFKENVNE